MSQRRLAWNSALRDVRHDRAATPCSSHFGVLALTLGMTMLWLT